MECSRIRRAVAWLLATSIILAGLCDCGHSQNDSATEGSGMTSLVPTPIPVNGNCYLVTEEMPLFVSSVCINYTATGKVYLYDYGGNPNTIHRDLMAFETFYAVQEIPDFCLEVIRAYGCNVIYPGCNPITGQPQGVCESDCVTYARGDLCESYLESAVGLSATSDVPLALNCSHTLAQFPLDFPYNKSDCWSISDLLEVPSPSPPSPPPFSSNMALITSVSVISVAVIVLLVGGICLYTVRHMRRKKRRKLRFQNHSAQHTPNVYHTNITLEDLLHDPDDDDDELPDGYFRLRAEDMDSITMDLRSTLIPFDHLEFIGDLGEGACYGPIQADMAEPWVLDTSQC